MVAVLSRPQCVNRNSHIFIQENTFENVVGKMLPFCPGLNVLTQVIYLITETHHCPK